MPLSKLKYPVEFPLFITQLCALQSIVLIYCTKSGPKPNFLSTVKIKPCSIESKVFQCLLQKVYHPDFLGQHGLLCPQSPLQIHLYICLLHMLSDLDELDLGLFSLVYKQLLWMQIFRSAFKNDIGLQFFINLTSLSFV